MIVGTLTIGQSPRTDIIPELTPYLPHDTRYLHVGALDGLTRAGVSAYSPQPGDSILVTRMGDGEEVNVGEQAIRGRMKSAVQSLESGGAQIILLLCTGVFENLPSKVLMIRPGRLLTRVVSAFMTGAKLGVIVPVAEQIEEAVHKWQPTGLHLLVEASSPYTGGPDQWRAAAHKLKLAGADLVVLDCLGFGKAARAVVREETGRPVLLPRTLMARVAAELIG